MWGRPHRKAWQLTDDASLTVVTIPSHINMSRALAPKPELLNHRGWKTVKGVALLSQRGCGAQQKDSWHRSQGNILSHAKTSSNKFWRKLSSGLLCRETYFMPLMGLWGGVQQTPEIALYLAKDEWQMRDFTSVWEKNKQQQLTWERTCRKFLWKE